MKVVEEKKAEIQQVMKTQNRRRGGNSLGGGEDQGQREG